MFEGDYRVVHYLAPPLLTKKEEKLRFGPWIRPVFAVLKKFRFLRGTALDPFGRTAERRRERRLIVDYFALVDELSARLTSDNLAVATELARLPEEIRGYGHVKHAAVERFEKRRAALLSAFDKRPPLDEAA